jgi:hypothetical protein
LVSYELEPSGLFHLTNLPRGLAYVVSVSDCQFRPLLPRLTCFISALLTVCFLTCFEARAAIGPVLYHTGFEVSEDYSTNLDLDLANQNGWRSDGSGGNGIVTNFFAGGGRQAYIGYSPPNPGDSNLFLYQPISQTLSRAQFSVNMMIVDSTNANYDDFYWAVYNQDVHQFFSLDFDNYELKVYYWLDDTNSRTWSGLKFANGVEYPLSIDIDFTSNHWSATFNGALLATNQPVTTAGAKLNLGDIDAGWGVYDPSAPGDNYMVFDDYTITGLVPPPQLTLLGRVAGGTALRLYGQSDTTFAIDASTNLVNWTTLKTNITTGGSFDYIDDRAAALGARYYRGRWVP